MVRLRGGPGADATANQRAAEAEAAVLGRFVGRFHGIPGTLMARTVASASDARSRVVVDRSTPFHYWWQAHLMDTIVDSGWRRLRGGCAAGAKHSARLTRRLLTTITLRNRGTLRNHYFDDMAWLALAVQRLEVLHRDLGVRARNLPVVRAQRALTRQLLMGRDADGSVFWNKERDFLNVPTAGPTALYLARSGRTDLARPTVEWVHEHLLDDRGLLLDGLLVGGARVDDAYTYNQGPTMAALLALGAPEDLRRVAALVQAVATHLTTTKVPDAVLVTHGGGDGGLFTGILARYLALAARDIRLDAVTRHTAGELVRSTARVLWDGRRRRGAHPFFPVDPSIPVDASVADGTERIELSTQLQGWMVMEAVATLSA